MSGCLLPNLATAFDPELTFEFLKIIRPIITVYTPRPRPYSGFERYDERSLNATAKIIPAITVVIMEKISFLHTTIIHVATKAAINKSHNVLWYAN